MIHESRPPSWDQALRPSHESAGPAHPSMRLLQHSKVDQFFIFFFAIAYTTRLENTGYYRFVMLYGILET